MKHPNPSIPSKNTWQTFWIYLFLLTVLCPSTSIALTQKEMNALLLEIDERQKNSGDHKTLAYLEQKEKNKNDLVYQVVIYRRDAEDKFMILFLEPKSEAGKGYLRIDKNLFMYDPSVGKWERRTERERIGGTDSRRADFDESRLAEEYSPEYVAEESLGKFNSNSTDIPLTGKKGIVPCIQAELGCNRTYSSRKIIP